MGSAAHLLNRPSCSRNRELSLVGNFLRPAGVASLVRPLVAVSEVNEGMPLLQKLHLQDNAVDGGGTDGPYAPVACLQVIRRWGNALFN